MKVPKEISEKLHGMTLRDWDELAKSDKADLTDDQKQSLYYFYTRHECREWISQKLRCDKNTVSRHNKYGLTKIVSYYNATKILPIIIIFLVIIILVL
jgi:hypothetical protein